MTVTFLYNFVLSNGIAVVGGAEALIVPAFGLVGGLRRWLMRVTSTEKGSCASQTPRRGLTGWTLNRQHDA
jgi:hypothetical protein